MSEAWPLLSAAEQANLGGDKKGFSRAAAAVKSLDYEPEEEFQNFLKDVGRLGKDKVLTSLKANCGMRDKAAAEALVAAVIKHGWTTGTAAKAKAAAAEDDDSSDDDLPPATKSPAATPKVAPKAAPKAAVDEDDSDDDDDDPPPPKKSPAAKPKAAPKVAADDDSDDSDDDAPPPVKAKAAAKPKAAAADDDSDDSDDDVPPPKAKAKAQAAAEDDDSDDDDDEPAAPKAKAAAAKPKAAAAEEDDDDDDSDDDDVPPAKKAAPKAAAEDEDDDDDEAKDSTSTKKVVSETAVFIIGLPYEHNKEKVKEDFIEFGEIKNIIMAVKANGRNKGFATIEFASKEAAAAALKLDGIKKYKRPLKVTMEGSREKTEGKAAASPAPTPKKAKNGTTPEKGGESKKPAAILKGSDFNAHIAQLMQAMSNNDFFQLSSLAKELSEKATAAAKVQSNNKFSINIKNLPKTGVTRDAMKATLKKEFEACKPNGIKVPIDDDGSSLKGLAVMFFKDEAGMQKACKMQVEVQGNKLKVHRRTDMQKKEESTPGKKRPMEKQNSQEGGKNKKAKKDKTDEKKTPNKQEQTPKKEASEAADEQPSAKRKKSGEQKEQKEQAQASQKKKKKEKA